MTSCLLIVNPSSGSEKANRYVKPMVMKLATIFDKVEVKETQKAFDATVFSKEAADAGVTAVFCMGGDGTVNETINGLVQAKHQPAFGFIPLGTVNDLARALKIPLKPSRAIDMLDTAKLVSIDIGRVNDRCFTNGVAIGTLSEAIVEVSAAEKTRLGSLAYFIKGMQALKEQKVYDFKIETGEEAICVKSSLIIVSLTNSLGSFEKFMPGAGVADGKMRLVIFKEFELFDTAKIIAKLLSGHLGKSKLVTVKPVRQVKITVAGNEPLSTNVDGDRGPELPLEIEVLPSYLQVYAPQ